MLMQGEVLEAGSCLGMRELDFLLDLQKLLGVVDCYLSLRQSCILMVSARAWVDREYLLGAEVRSLGVRTAQKN